MARYLRDRDLQREINEGLNVGLALDVAPVGLVVDVGQDVAGSGRSWRDAREVQAAVGP